MEPNRRQFIKGLSAPVGATLLAGCSGGGESNTQGGNGGNGGNGGGQTGAELFPNRELNLAVAAASDSTVDQHQTGGIQNAAAITLTYERLIDRDLEGNMQPMLATDWGREEPGRFRCELREGVSWHNGDEFTAEDVAFSVDRIQDPDVHLTSDLQGNLPGITGTEIIDDYTIDILSDGFNSFVETALSHFLGLVIVNKDWIEARDPSETAINAMGTGPMQLVDVETGGVSATFEIFEDYWGELPEWANSVDTVTIKWIGESSSRVSGLRAEEYMIAESVPPADVQTIEQAENLSLNTSPTSRVIKIVMDQRQEPWNIWEMREAMNLAVDQDAYINDIMDGFAVKSTQPTLPQMFGYDPDIEPIGYDPDRAEELIDEAGFSGIELQLTVPTGRYLLGEEFGLALVDQINQLSNVTCEADIVDYGNFTDAWVSSRPLDMDFFIVGYGHPAWDGRETINSTLLNTDSQSRFGENPRYDELQDLFDRSIRAPRDEAEELTKEMNRLCVEERCWVFLHGQQALIGHNNALDYRGRQDELVTPLDSGINQ